MRKFRRLSPRGKLTALLVILLLAGAISGSDQAVALSLLLLAVMAVWVFASRVAQFVRRRTYRSGTSKRLNNLPMPSSKPNPAAPLAPTWAPPLNHNAHAPGIGDVLALTPGQFEELTAALLDSIGYTSVQRTGKAGDLGADIVCRDPQGRSTIVQCKRYAPGSTIGTPVVQTFIGMMTVHHRVERGLIVATVPFTQQAVDLARQHGVALIDGPALLLLLHLTGIPLYRQVNAWSG